MRLAVVAYPNISPADRHWIESLRAKHDPQASLIDVHFTLVFPFDGVPADLGHELAAVAQTVNSISFGIRDVRVAPDHRASTNHIFLVPGDGEAEITALHDRLYSGVLQKHLCADIPFVPHLTIGADSDRQRAEQFAATLIERAPLLFGEITGFALINVGVSPVATISAYPTGKA